MLDGNEVDELSVTDTRLKLKKPAEVTEAGSMVEGMELELELEVVDEDGGNGEEEEEEDEE